MIGQTVSHYKILEKLGEGGMGIVYRAEDTRLKRAVALKFLPPELTRHMESKSRFVNEAQAAAALNHPNICTIYEIDEHDDQSFIAMELVDGHDLKGRIESGPLSIDDAVSIAIQIAEGLHEAHDKGIVHRDIKPGNIMLTSRDQAKILDFGLARLGERTKITRKDTILGTAAYMSPEQASGRSVDRRTDIWSLGVMLYEMVTGQRPFTGDYELAVVYSILHDEPESLSSRRSNVPLELERIVERALAKDPSERYQHVEDMLVDLRALLSATQTAPLPKGSREARSRRNLMIAVAAAVIVTVLALAILSRLLTPSPPTGEQRAIDDRKMLVVLPFENMGAPDDEYFANGVTDAITARLASVKGLGVISRQSAMQYKGVSKTIRVIGEELGVDYILEGTVQRERPSDPTSRVRVIPQLVRVADDTHVWAGTYDEDMTEVFRVQSDIAERVAMQLDVALLEPERRAIENRPTENLEAYENYLRGLDYSDRYFLADMEIATHLLQRAVSLDPEFAEAWAGLAMAYHTLYWVFDRVGELTRETKAAEQAYQLAPDLPETHLALGYVDYANRRFESALAHFETARSLRSNWEALRATGYTLRRLGKWQEALDQFEEAQRLIPRYYSFYLDGLGYTNACLRHFEESERYLDRAISLSPHLSGAYLIKADVVVRKDGDIEGTRQVLGEMIRKANLVEAVEGDLIQAAVVTSRFRLFPDIWTDVFDAFELRPIERYRRTHPGMIAALHLARGIVYDAESDRPNAIARYDSASVHFERIIRSNPQSAYIASYHGALALAYVGLGRNEEGMREAEEAVRLIPISKDAVIGTDLIENIAEVYVMCGEYDAAIDQLETLLSVPSYISVGLLRVDSLWDPLRDHPRFRRLLEKDWH